MTPPLFRRARQLAVLFTALCAVSAIAPAVAPAAKVKKAALRGQVVGTPYVADTRTAVPVLLSKESARKAGLKSPIGVMLLPRTSNVPTPGGGKSKPGNLRLGDKFRAVGEITKEARGAVYARVNAVPTTFEVYRRGKTLSTAELEALVTQLQNELAKVKANLNGLVNYTLGEFQKIRDELGLAKADIATLKTQMAELQAALAALKKQLEDLTAALNAQLASLTSTVNGLLSTVSGLTTTVTGLVSTVNGLVSTVNGLTSQVTGLVSQVGGLVSQLTTLQTAVGTLQGVVGSLSNADLQAAITKINTLFADLQGGAVVTGLVSDLSTLSSQVTTLGNNLQGQLDTVNSTLSGVATDAELAAVQTALTNSISGVQTTLSGQITTVSTNLSTLNTQVQDIQLDVDVLCGPSSVLNNLC